MDRSVAAIGATSGSLSAVLLKILHGALASPVPDLLCPDCPSAFDLSDIQVGELDLVSLAFGVGIGLCIGPLLDFIYLLRQTWRCWIRERLQVVAKQSGEPLYRLA